MLKEKGNTRNLYKQLTLDAQISQNFVNIDTKYAKQKGLKPSSITD